MSKDDATWLNVAYVCFALLVAYFAYSAIEMVGIQTGWAERLGWYAVASTLGSLVVGALAAFGLRADKDRHEYLLQSVAELRKVTWPSWNDTSTSVRRT